MIDDREVRVANDSLDEKTLVLTADPDLETALTSDAESTTLVSESESVSESHPSQVADSASTSSVTEKRFRQLLDANYRRTDRLFAKLLIGQFALGLLLAVFVAP